MCLGQLIDHAQQRVYRPGAIATRRAADRAFMKLENEW